MPRLTRRPPRLCHHKASGQAIVYINGRERYLGPYGSAEAQAAYHKLVAELLEGKAIPAPPAPPSAGLTVAEAIVRFWTWAQQRYRHPDGTPTREAENFRYALKPLRKLYGRLPLAEFSPNKLRDVREAMVLSGLSRGTVNARVGKVRRFTRWCAGHELCPAAVPDALRHVEPLRAGQGGRETDGRGPVSWATVERTLPHLSPLLQAAVRVLWYTGARVGEVARLTTGEIDQTGDVWQAKLGRHKCAWRGQGRVILLGPEAVGAIKPWLRPDAPAIPIFDPKRADVRSSKRKGTRAPRPAYDRHSLAHALRRACDRAGIPPWTLGQLRHSRATELRERFGLDVAAVVLGHAKPTMTAHYSRAAIAHAEAAVRQAG